MKKALHWAGNPSKHFDPVGQLSSDTQFVSKLQLFAAWSYVFPQCLKYIGWSKGIVGELLGGGVGLFVIS